MPEDEDLRGSFASAEDLEEEEGKVDKESTKGKVPQVEGTLFDLLREIRDAVVEKDNGIVHQLCRIADAVEVLSGKTPKKEEKVVEKTTPPPAEKKVVKEKKRTPPPTRRPSQPRRSDLFQDIQRAFKDNIPPELFKVLKFDDAKDGVFVDIDGWLKPRDFSELMGVTRQLEGEYIPKKGDTKGFIIFKR